MRILAILLALGTSATAADTSADYDSKMKAALDNYAARSDEILQRAIKEGKGGGAAAVDTVQIDANGDILPSSSFSSTGYVDFGLAAVNQELDRIEKLHGQIIDPHDLLEEDFTKLTAKNGGESATITYSQLEDWEELTDIFHQLKEGEFLTLWQKATGSESQGGEMTLSQFATFNDLLDKLLMAKADFITMTEGKDIDEGISFDELWHMDALSDFISPDDFLEFWQESMEVETKKGFMKYEQFLVFWELASDWLEHEYDNEGVSFEEEEEDEHFEEDDSGDEEDGSGDDDDDDAPVDYHGIVIRDEPDFYIEDEDLTDDHKADLKSTEEYLRAEAMMRRTLDPERWGEFLYWELHAFFACDKLFSKPRPLWTDQQWRDVRDFYHEFVEEDKNDVDGPEGLRSYQFSADEYDLTQNAIPFQSGEKGRGLRAIRDIKAGELVFKATNNTIVFNYGHTWRKLLFAINERFNDPGITCDMHVWSWVQDLYDGGPMKVVMDLDSGSLLNEGRDDPGWEPPNVQCGKPDATRCDMDYYAFRDIKEGDELLIDYREFAFLESWPAMGL